MPIAAHIRWLCGIRFMLGVHVALKIVRDFDRCRTRIAASLGSPRAVRTAAGLLTTFASTSRTAACGSGSRLAATQSATKRSRSIAAALDGRDGASLRAFQADMRREGA